MFHFFEALTNTSGESLIGYFARVVDRSTQGTVTIYSDESGTPIQTVSGVANMAKTDDFGNLDLYVEPGTYNLDIFDTDATTFRFRVSNVSMNATKGDKGDQGDQGEPGPAENTYTTLTAFKASDISRKKASLSGLGSLNGDFFWTEADFTGQADDINIVKADSTALSVGAWVRQTATTIQAAAGRNVGTKLQEQVSVLDFKATGSNDLARFQSPIDEDLRRVFVPASDYSLTGTVDLAAAQGSQFVGAGLGDTNVVATGSSPVFDFVYTEATEGIGPYFEGFKLFGGAGVRINDPTSNIPDFADAKTVFRWGVTRMHVYDNANRVGVGVQLTKAFNGSLQDSEVRGFEIGVHFNGSDINKAENNRIWQFEFYGILETSSGTFGSQNLIVGNDILGGASSPSAIYYKSTSQHVQFNSNYLEADNDCQGYIDISKVGVPTFGSNVQTTSLSVVLRDNRMDQQDRAGFIYRIDPAKAATVRVEGIATTGAPADAVIPSYFCDASGNPLTHIPLFLTSGRRRYVYLEENTFGPRWNGYRASPAVSPGANGFLINSTNVESFIYNATGADGVAHFHGEYIVIPQARTNEDLGIRVGGTGGGNPYFPASATVEVTVLARSTSASGDTMRIQVSGKDAGGGDFGTAFTDFALTNQFKPFTFTFAGYAADYQTVGFNVRKSTGNGDVEFVLSFRVVP